jgi:CBS domain containing-hemolysin-like protein
LFRGRNGESALRETIDEIIEEIEEGEDDESGATPITDDERNMLANLLTLRHQTAYDVMVPRADIVAVEADVELDELLELMGRVGHSRLPVYRGTLDDVVGLVHIKDVLPLAGGQKPLDLASVTRKVLFVAPSMRVLDLLLEMRQSRVHMALVVDEFGGIDGLITIEDLVEEIVGEITDEHDVQEGPKLLPRDDGSLLADGRTTIEEFEEQVGPVLSEEEREEDIDTLGGLVFSLAGRVPARGELLVHPHSNITFEVLQADPRRVHRLKVTNLPARDAGPGD